MKSSLWFECDSLPPFLASVTSLLLAIVASTSAQCPSQCDCEKAATSLYVNCRGKGLTEIPAGIPEATTNL